jgi:hypothetical protein
MYMNISAAARFFLALGKMKAERSLKNKKHRITGALTPRRQHAAWRSVWLGHSAPQRSWGTLHSHAPLHPHFASPGLVAHFLIRACNNVAYTRNVMRGAALI